MTIGNMTRDRLNPGRSEAELFRRGRNRKFLHQPPTILVDEIPTGFIGGWISRDMDYFEMSIVFNIVLQNLHHNYNSVQCRSRRGGGGGIL
ncbi:hypothetical protein RRG08_050586 [Elysia crispata]|uniref:Uncharacterized protein n=1 Tax=Elysia crispata TaxID=231223 RepID=A0AAE0Z741_9GAST|nr:hypothetical protein RRG08_050586 [Elysia crispata]